MSEEIEKSGFILPIVCPHCQKEIEVSMELGLLPPKEEVKQEKIKE